MTIEAILDLERIASEITERIQRIPSKYSWNDKDWERITKHQQNIQSISKEPEESAPKSFQNNHNSPKSQNVTENGKVTLKHPTNPARIRPGSGESVAKKINK